MCVAYYIVIMIMTMMMIMIVIAKEGRGEWMGRRGVGRKGAEREREV